MRYKDSTKWTVFSLLLFSVAECFDSPEAGCPPCDLTNCGVEEECKLGKTYDPCDCCLVCLKGTGEACGGPKNYKGKCAPGYECRDSLQRVLFFSRGKNAPTGICTQICPPCEEAKCPQKGSCEFGSRKDSCGCCSECLKGPGESCAGPNNSEGRCGGEGYACFDDFYREILPKCREDGPVGICMLRESVPSLPPVSHPPFIGCPSCDFTVCSNYPFKVCEYGAALSPNSSECCPVCLKGPDEPCSGDLNCAEGLICEMLRGSKTVKRGGRCRKPRKTKQKTSKIKAATYIGHFPLSRKKGLRSLKF